VRHRNILYFAHPVFRHYRTYGAVANREPIACAIRNFLGESISLTTNLPSTARVALASQPEEKRHDLHLLAAARLVPQGTSLPLEVNGDRVSLRLPEFSCHQMIELQG
jgi:hypothetical protein